MSVLHDEITTLDGSTHYLLSRLNQVSSRLVPAQGAATRDQEWLRLVARVEQFAKHAEAVAEHGDEGRRNVRGTRSSISCQNGVREFDRSGNATCERWDQ